MTNISKWLAAHASWIVIIVAAVTFFFPQLFAWVSGQTQTIILGIIMLSMGLTLTPEDFRVLAKRPGDILIGTFAQFTVMPLVAWSLWHVFGLPAELALGIMLVGCCPGGVSSNIMSFLCHGDVAFSVGMTTVSTLIAPIATPLLMLWLAGQTVEVDAMGMFFNILIVTLIPVGIGFGLNVWLGHKSSFKTLQQVMPGVGVLALASIVGGVVSAVQPDLIKGGVGLFFLTFAVVLCHNSLGYFLGYMAGKLFHFSTAKNRTISIEVGMQNAGLATNLATNFFLATMPLAVVPCAISCAWHSISGTLLAGWFARKGSIRLRSERVTRNSASYKQVNSLYEQAFPADERAPLDMLVDGREWNGDFRAYYSDGEFVGFAFNYVDDRFCYLFYLAVEPHFRKRGIGSAILRDIAKTYPRHNMILEMEELDPTSENYQERLQRSHFYQGNGLQLSDVHNTQCGVSYQVLSTDPTITLADYSNMWHNIVRIQGYSPEEGQQWLDRIFGDSLLPKTK